MSVENARSGRAMPVLFERAGRHPGQLVGRSPYLQAVHAQADSSFIGQVVEVEIDRLSTNSLSGTVTERRLQPA